MSEAVAVPGYTAAVLGRINRGCLGRPVLTQRDVTGRYLKMGDSVVTTLDGYSNLTVVKIIGFTAKKIRVEKPDGGHCLKCSDQVCYVEKLSW